CRDEDHRHFPDAQDLVDRVDSAAAIRQLYIGEDEARTRMHDGFERGMLGSLEGNDVVSEAEPDRFEIGCDGQLILDDQDVGFHMARDCRPRFPNQVGEAAPGYVENATDLGVVEFLYNAEEKCLPRQRRQADQSALGARVWEQVTG